MSFRSLATLPLVLVSLVAACGPSSELANDEATGHTESALSQQSIAVPSYFTDWTALLQKSPPAKLAIVNNDSGPYNGWYDYSSNISAAQSKGVRVVGYVDTAYMAKLEADVQAEINSWYSQYPSLQGIFFDQVRAGSGATACSDSSYTYYSHLASMVHAHSGAWAVLNPGSPVPSCYPSNNLGDLIVTFEGSADTYLNAFSSTNRGWETAANSGKIWHIVYGTSSTQLGQVLDASRSRQAGYVYVTDLPFSPNPFASIAGFWAAEADNVSGWQASAIRSYFAQNDATTVYYEANFTQAFPRKHVFIDTDRDPNTGYKVAGIGANYMIENDNLYSMATGTSWAPTLIGSSSRTGAAGGTAGVTGWRINRSSIGETASPNSATIVFHGGGTGFTDAYAPAIIHTYTP